MSEDKALTQLVEEAVDKGATTAEEIHRSIAELPIKVLEEIRSSDPDRVTPMEALSALQDWHRRLRENDTS